MLVQLVFGFLVAVAIFVPLERVFALRRDQKVLHRGWRSDPEVGGARCCIRSGPAQHVLDAPPALSSNAGTIEEPPLVPA
jgi:hypothetical protein